MRRIALLWSWTCRFELEDPNGWLESTDRHALFALWHEQLFCGCMFIARETTRGRSVVTLISPSVDGDTPSNVAMNQGLDVVRGSAEHGGAEALRTLVKAIRANPQSAFLITDGPRGPARKSKQGVARLARLAKLPLVPVVCLGSKERRLRNWDRMRIHSPFSKIRVVLGDAIPLGDRRTDDETQDATQALDRALSAMTKAAESEGRQA